MQKGLSKDHTDVVTYEQSFNGDERENYANAWRFLVRTSAKALRRRKHAWQVKGTARMAVWLEQMSKEGE